MMNPVGNLPARVYWRRRLVFVALPLLVIILLLWAALSGGGGKSNARTTSGATTASSTSTSTSAPATSTQPRDTGSIGVSTTAPKATAPKATTPFPTSPAVTPTTSAPAVVKKGFCNPAALTVAAETSKKSFAVKSKPELSMLVTNTTAASCQLDVADKHAEWQVFAGPARVWGSHDCSVKKGSHVITLTARQAIRLSISWSGLTSAPNCTGARLAVQTGTYKLFAYLDGKASPAITFMVT